MKKLTAIILVSAMVGGCSTNRVVLAPGQNGSVAVLDPKSQSEVSVIDKPGSEIDVAGGKASKAKAIDQATFDRTYGEVMNAMPKQPRGFTLYFKVNSVEPTDASNAEMPAIFEEIKSRSGADIQVTGHTDTVGSLEVNDTFSLKRAAEITAYLFTLGLDKTIVRLAGRGERELKEQTPDETPSDTNRRVEVLVR